MDTLSFESLSLSLGRQGISSELPVVCVQGLGFVGSAMAVAVAQSTNSDSRPLYNVIGVDLPTEEGKRRIDSLNRGELPFKCKDQKLHHALQQAAKKGNFIATSNSEAYQLASIVIVDVPLDIKGDPEGQLVAEMKPFQKAIEILGENIKQDALVIVESTVPPGTCEKIVLPILKKSFENRGFNPDQVLLAHAYERVMPGENYLNSISNFWRVFSAASEDAAIRCEDFLSQVIDVKQYPLTRLDSMTASESAKILENSYRAMSIAFMEEWGRFAESAGFNIFPVIDAIRKRPTHSNIRQPGFGVGGYCLTKDPLFMQWASRELFKFDHDFKFCNQITAVNEAMPLVSVGYLEKLFGGGLEGKKILLLGISYRENVGDTRYSPSETFYRSVAEKGAEVICHDPLVEKWVELDIVPEKSIPSFDLFDAVVFAVGHQEYRQIDLQSQNLHSRPIIFDANHILSEEQIQVCKSKGSRVFAIGRGEIL